MKGCHQLRLGLAAGLLSLTLIGCSDPASTDAETGATEVSPQVVRRTLRGRTLRDASQRVQVQLPRGWEPAPSGTLHDSADIYARNVDERLYLLVVSENDSNVQRFGIDDNAHEYRMLLANALDSPPELTRTDVNEINGPSAVQYEISGRVDGVAVVYLHTTVVVEDTYYQIVTWTEESRFPIAEEEFQEVIGSFRTI